MGIWLAKARSSGVIVKGQSVCGVETKTTSSKQDQTWVVQPVISQTHWLPCPGKASWVVRPFPRNLCWVEIKMEGKTGGFSRGERGLFTFKNHKWLFRAAHDLLFPHCVSGGLSAHPHTTFLSYNKQKNTKHMSESHMFVLSWLLPHLCDQYCPSPAQLHFQLKERLVAKYWVCWDIWGHLCALAEMCGTMRQSGWVPHPNASLSYLFFL